MKTKRPFGGNYKTYDPKVEGYGTPNQWRGNFSYRMGAEQAREILQAQRLTPYEILGVKFGCGADEISKAYRRKAMECHPDRCIVNNMTVEEATEKFKILSAAYTKLT